MQRWLAFSVSRGGTAARAGLAVAGVAVGVAAEATAFAWDDSGHWGPDLLVGLVFVCAGSWALRWHPDTGLLLAVTGFTWFAGTLASSVLYLHRGPLVHAVVAYPGLRPPSRLALATIAGGWMAAVVTPVWGSESAALALGLGLVVAGCVEYWMSPRGRVRRLVGLWTTLALGGTVALGAAVRLAVPAGDAVEPLLLGYEAVLCGVAVALAVHLRAPAGDQVADLVVELGETPSGTLRDALATTLGDPTLEVGYWQTAGTYVDAAGTPIALPSPGDSRVATYVERDAHRFAVVVHDPSVLDEPAVADAVATATRLTAANAVLQGDVRAHLADLTASRRRLLLAGDEERQRLEARLRTRVERRLVGLADTLREASVDLGSASGHVRRAQAHLDRTLDDLQVLARGLHPGELHRGLPAALTALTQRSPVPVDLTVPGGNAAGGDAAVAAYFVCAEALANVAKHAHTDRVTVRVDRTERALLVTVTDDGAGGADPAGGTGLRNLADRVEAVGGTLRVESPIGAGTRLVAELPLDHHPAP